MPLTFSNQAPSQHPHQPHQLFPPLSPHPLTMSPAFASPVPVTPSTPTRSLSLSPTRPTVLHPPPHHRGLPRLSPRIPRATATAPTQATAAPYDGCDLSGFAHLASAPSTRLVPLWRTVFGDQLTPVMAYRCLVSEDEKDAPSFLLESVHTGARVGRYSYVGARPAMQVTATAMCATIVEENAREGDGWIGRVALEEQGVTAEAVVDAETGRRTTSLTCEDPWALIRKLTEEMKAASPAELPGGAGSFSGGWVGYGGYDTMRYSEIESLPFSSAPEDDRGLPDLSLGLYRDVIVFDHITKVVFVVHWVDLARFPGASGPNQSASAIAAAHEEGVAHLDKLTATLARGQPLSPLVSGTVAVNMGAGTDSDVINSSNMTREEFDAALDKIHTHIVDGDAFQVVFSQRFERWSTADPFSTYRALRVINPSPYMIYVQTEGSSLVASSPEILCRVVNGVITNRPLAGTRPRGRTVDEDLALEKEMLADQKDLAEHTMLVDLGRNDVGRIAEYGSVLPVQLMEVERYSNVMHISSTVTGNLREGLASWDALRAQLPVGTISGAPKIRAMQIIDDLEPTRRGPYGGGIGYISFGDTMNMALALRTMVIPHATRMNADGVEEWRYHLQAGAGIVLDSQKDMEYQETVNKAMALNRAIDLAETAFDFDYSER